MKDLYQNKKKQLEELNKEIESLDKINSKETIIKELKLKKYNLEKVIKDVSLRIKNHSYIACLEIQVNYQKQEDFLHNYVKSKRVETTTLFFFLKK